MSEFKYFDGGEPFIQPEKPFLLIYEDTNEEISYSFLETEEDMMDVIKEIQSYGCSIIHAIEISSCRDVIYSSFFELEQE